MTTKWTISVLAVLVLLILVSLAFLGHEITTFLADIGARGLSGRGSSEPSDGATAARAVVEEILDLGGRARSRHGRKYRAAACVITRNEARLREILVRNLLVGYNHFFVYDNNQIAHGVEYSLTPMLEPFVAAGAVTHTGWEQNRTERLIENDNKDKSSLDCVLRFGNLSDWISVLDTDEVIYIADATEDQETPETFGTLGSFLDTVESKFRQACYINMPWRMMYSDTRVGRPGELLMDAFHRVLRVWAHKILFRPERVAVHDLPHFVECTNGSTGHDTDDVENFMDTLGKGSFKVREFIDGLGGTLGLSFSSYLQNDLAFTDSLFFTFLFFLHSTRTRRHSCDFSMTLLDHFQTSTFPFTLLAPASLAPLQF